jgi:hypothetical protein
MTGFLWCSFLYPVQRFQLNEALNQAWDEAQMEVNWYLRNLKTFSNGKIMYSPIYDEMPTKA